MGTLSIGKSTFQDANLDAFGRLRVSVPITQFESKFTYGNEEKTFDTTTANGGSATFLSNEAAWALSTTGDNGSRVRRQSFRYLQYHPGKSQLVLLTGVFGSAVNNCVKRIGYYDDNDGLFFAQNGITGFGIVERSSTSGSPVDTMVYQSSWNIDKLNGSGSSKITLDVTKTNIFVIDFQWLGVGTVRYGVVINGQLIYVHQSHHANNSFTKVYMKSAWLPIRYEIHNLASTTGTTLKQICCSVTSEGGMEEIGSSYTASQPTALAAGTTVWVPIVSIKVPNTFNGVPFRGKVHINSFETLVVNNTACAVALLEGGTLTGASWVNANNTAATQYDISATAVSGGTFRNTGFNGKSSNASVVPSDQLTGYANSVYTLVAKGVGGNSSLVGAINWREVI